ncbi:MAG: enoyl-CoA hydratase/isomerase family protein [Chloroflexi bacterium]|nr:enoyl-CoA hydratase/isomerase family protein [Chloroflexota bacterium]
MAYQYLLYEKDGVVVVITFNRPEALNAIIPGLEAELHQALDEADADAEVRAIILTGAGRAFSAGYDMAPRPERAQRPDPRTAYAGELLRSWWSNDFRNIQYLMHLWYLSKPVIAAVNGWCMGGAFWYSAACDITIASDQATFAQPEVRHISNSTFLFSALCGWKVANRYALTGDHLDAQEAYRIGLVNEVVPHDQLMERAKALANRIALVPEPAVRYNKYVTTLGLEASGIRSGLLMNAALSALAHSSHMPENDRLNEARDKGGMRAFLEARDAPFQPEPFGPRSRNRPGSLR